MKFRKMLALFTALSMVMTLFGGFAITTEAASMSESTFFAKLNYSAYPGLSAVKAAVDKGDYEAAKAELLKYYRQRTQDGTVKAFDITETDANIGMANLAKDYIITGPYEFDVWVDTIKVDSKESTQYTASGSEITTHVKNEVDNKNISFMLFERQKQQYPIYVASREDEANSPKLIVTLEGGDIIEIKPNKDTFISSGNKGTNYGNAAELEIKEQSDNVSEAFGTQTRRAYINFPLTELAGKNIEKAELKFTARLAQDCTLDALEMHILSVGDTTWNENSFTWNSTNNVGNTYSWQNSESGPWWTKPSGCDSEYLHVALRYWYARPMVWEYLKYVNDPEGYPEGKEYGEKMLVLMNAITQKYDQTTQKSDRTIEFGERNNRWVDVLYNLLPTPVLDPEVNENAAEYFYNIVNYMWGDMNFTRNNSNLGWSNWGAVYLAGMQKAYDFFPEFTDYNNWRSYNVSRLNAKFKELYNSDMSFTESGPAYAIWCAELFGDAYRMAAINNKTLGSEYKTMLTYATRFAMECSYPNGYDTNIGDSNFRPRMDKFITLAEALNDPHITNYVTGGSEGESEYLTSFYKNANSAYMRTSWNPDEAVYVNYTNNPSGGHAHPDLNQVLLYAYGQPLLVDSGRYGYSGGVLYNEFRTAQAHNTIEADAINMGINNNYHDNTLPLAYTVSNDKFDFAASSHKNFASNNITHTRNVLFLRDGYAVVSDYVTGNSVSQTYHQNWHFLPSSNAEADGNIIKTNFFNKANITLAAASADSAEIKSGYHSADYGLASVSEFGAYGKTGKNVKFDTLLYPTKAGENSNVTAVDLAPNDVSKGAVQLSGDVNAYYYIKNTDDADGIFASYSTDAKMAYVDENMVAMVDGTTVSGGAIEISSPNKLEEISVSVENGVLAINGGDLGANSSPKSAIAIKADGVNSVTLNGEVVDFETDGEYIYAAGLASVTTIENIGEIKAGKDGFVKQDGTNEGAVSSDRDKIQAAISGWAARNAYAAFDLTDYVGKFNKAVLKMNVVEAASGGKIDFYWLDYGTWTRDSLSFVVDSSKMPTNTTSNGATFTGYSYRFDGNVSGIGVGQTFEVDMTNALNEYLANGGSPKFTLAMLSETGSTKFASINHASLAGPTIVLTNEVTEGVEKVTKVNITLVNDKGEEIGSDVVTDVTAGQLYTYDAPKFIGNYALDRNSNLGVMVKEGENYITVNYVPAITVNAKYVCGNEVVKTEEVGISAPDSIFAYEPGMVVRTETGDYLVDRANSVLSVKVTNGGENAVTVALEKITIKGDNLVADGSFEGGSLDSSVWKRWNGSSMVNDIKWSIDSANAQSGNNSLMCVEGGGGTSTGNIVGQFPLPDVKAGKTYILSMWIYSSNGSLTLTTGLSKNAAQQEVDISCGGLGNTGTDPVSCNISFEANKWVNLSYVLTANSASKCAEIYARWGSPNDTRIDNIELYEFEYDTIADVTINYVDSDGKEIADSKVVKAEIGTTFDASAYELPTMWKRSGVLSVLDAEKTGATTIEVQKGENTINLVYSEQEYDGVVLDLSFDDEETGFEGGLGKAQIKGSAPLVDGVKGKAVSLTSSNFLNVVNKDGGSLLTGMDEITITFMSKVNTTGASWDFFAASNTNAQSYENEHYLGFLEKDNNITIERYNGGPRAATVNAASTQEWKEIAVVVEKGKTTLYIDGVKAGEQASSYLLSDILGSNSVFQIGKANWNSGEYFDGMIDEFKIYDRALTADEIANLNKENFTFDGTTAAVSGVEGYIIVVAQYDSEGRMVDVKTSKEATLTVTKAESAVKAVAFLWNGISEMEPVAEAIEVDLK